MFEQFIIIISFIPGLLSHTQVNEAVKSENVIAVYIYNFTKFLEWPNNDSEYFYISILGKSEIVEPLNIIAEKEKVKGKKIIINELKNINDLKRNSVLFLSSGEESKLFSILKKTSGKNILTISDLDGSALKGVCINFLTIDNKIKFEINRKAMEEAGIIPNTRLLSLALKVYE